MTTNYATYETPEDLTKRKNFMYIGSAIGFVWIVFHFTVVYFFGIVLNSLFLVGLFLGIGNFVGFLFDIPIGVLQKYFKPKSLFIFASVLLLVSGGIFAKFFYFSNLEEILKSGVDALGTGGTEGVTSTIMLVVNKSFDFAFSGLNWVLILITACFYGIIKELFDVTSLSYIMDNSDPSQYGDLIAKNNVFYGIGALIGLLSSGVILILDIRIALILLIIFILGLLFVIITFFDNPDQTITDMPSNTIKLILEKRDINKMKNFVTEKIQQINLQDVVKHSKYIILKPMEIKSQINFTELFVTSFQTYKNVLLTFMSPPISRVIVWTMLVMTLFGFWDTFVSTFQIEFLNKIISLNQDDIVLKNAKFITGYVLLALLVIPIFTTQFMFIKLGDKIGGLRVITVGMMISGISIMVFGLSSQFGIVLTFGLLNSIGYAATMPLAQGIFSETYNKVYSEKMNLKEIDSNASAAPLKMISNLANVLGLVIGGALVSAIGFNIFFSIFGIAVLTLVVATLLFMSNFEI